MQTREHLCTPCGRSHAGLGWAAVAVVVALYDGWALTRHHETMSGFFWRHSKVRPRGVLLVGAWLSLTWHILLGDRKVLPPHHSERLRQFHPVWVIHRRLVGLR